MYLWLENYKQEIIKFFNEKLDDSNKSGMNGDKNLNSYVVFIIYTEK